MANPFSWPWKAAKGIAKIAAITWGAKEGLDLVNDHWAAISHGQAPPPGLLFAAKMAHMAWTTEKGVGRFVVNGAEPGVEQLQKFANEMYAYENAPTVPDDKKTPINNILTTPLIKAADGTDYSGLVLNGAKGALVDNNISANTLAAISTNLDSKGANLAGKDSTARANLIFDAIKETKVDDTGKSDSNGKPLDSKVIKQFDDALDALKDSEQAAKDPNTGLTLWLSAAALKNLEKDPNAGFLTADQVKEETENYNKWKTEHPNGSEPTAPEAPRPTFQESLDQWHDSYSAAQKGLDQLKHGGKEVVIRGYSAYFDREAEVRVGWDDNTHMYKIEAGVLDSEGNLVSDPNKSGGRQWREAATLDNLDYNLRGVGARSINENGFDSLHASLACGVDSGPPGANPRAQNGSGATYGGPNGVGAYGPPGETAEQRHNQALHVADDVGLLLPWNNVRREPGQTTVTSNLIMASGDIISVWRQGDQYAVGISGPHGMSSIQGDQRVLAKTLDAYVTDDGHGGVGNVLKIFQHPEKSQDQFMHSTEYPAGPSDPTPTKARNPKYSDARPPGPDSTASPAGGAGLASGRARGAPAGPPPTNNYGV